MTSARPLHSTASRVGQDLIRLDHKNTSRPALAPAPLPARPESPPAPSPPTRDIRRVGQIRHRQPAAIELSHPDIEQRGTEIRYYRCPNIMCRARRCPAELIEQEVLVRISEGVLAESLIARARVELRQRVETPEVVTSGRQRARLEKRLEQLQKQHGWGDLSDADYRAERDAAKAVLARLADGDRVVAFDAHRARILALRDAIAVATPTRQEELCRIVIEQVVVRDRQVESVVWTPPVRPFFETQWEYPQGCLGSAHRRHLIGVR